MSSKKESWKLQTLPFDENLREALLQQHHAAQYIALAGRYLIEQQPDDSNTNMQFLTEKGIFVGNRMANGSRLAYNPDSLVLQLLDKNDLVLGDVPLAAKSKLQAFEDLKKVLAENAIDVSAFKNELHYDMPAHKLDNGALFNTRNKSAFEENTKQRYNAEIILSEILSAIPKAEALRVWPHHFDTGSFIPVSYNAKGGLSQSIGVGWTVADSMIDEPYYYLSFWSEEGAVPFDKLPALHAGSWITTGWQGGVLKLSDIVKETSASAQYDLLKKFFNSGIEILQRNFKQHNAV